jgi:predicted peptidase
MLSLAWILFIAQVMPNAANQDVSHKEAPPIATGFLYKTITLDHETFAYCVYVPPEYTAEKAWPLILFLHGSGERGEDGFRETEIGVPKALRRDHSRIPAIVVMPQCRPNAAWTGEMAAMALHCVEATSREYRIDHERVYLTGLSLGGQGTWLLGAQYEQDFAAIVPVCGFAELGQETGLAARLAQHLTDIPIWCWHGGADTHVPASKAREMVEAIQKAGGHVKYTEVAGAGHDVWDKAYEDPELWKWLFSQKRATKKSDQP